MQYYNCSQCIAVCVTLIMLSLLPVFVMWKHLLCRTLMAPVMLCLWAATLLTVIPASLGSLSVTKYQPNWDSLDTRPLPPWFDEVKFGVFIHWGVFSVPAFGDEWFWDFWVAKIPRYVKFMKDNYPPGFTYGDFAAKFTAEFYDPDFLADVVEASGAKYLVFSSKHHDGYTTWPATSSFMWNCQDVGPKRDLLGDMAKAIRKKKDIKFGIYHSLFEWFNPIWLRDKNNNFTTRDFAQNKAIPELVELVNNYKPEVIWSDGAPANYTYWKSPEFLAWLYNDSPVKDTVVVNDRWGHVDCKHGDFYSCQDRYNPGRLINHKWENAMTLDSGSWGYRRDTTLKTFLTIERLIYELVSTVSCGGNILMNFGPTHDGRIIPIEEERLRQVGSWLKVNGEAIYGSKPWQYQNDTVTKGVWYTSKKNEDGTKNIYATALFWPDGGLTLGAPEPSVLTTVTMLGYPDPILYTPLPSKGMKVNVPVIPINKMPCQWGWVFKLTYLKNM